MLFPLTREPVLISAHLALIGLFVSLAYYPSLRAGFAFDDLANIVVNPYVHAEGFSDLGRALASPLSGTRPLAMVSFALNHWLGRLDPYGYHAVNLLVHLLNAFLLYQVLVVMGGLVAARGNDIDSRQVIRLRAFWGAALWALNPVQTQAVTYIVQRMTSLATLFYLLGILIFLLYRAGRLRAPGAASLITLCFLLGMASKEIVVTLPLALVLADVVLLGRRGKAAGWALALAGAVIAGAGIFYLRAQLPDLLQRYPNREFSPYERWLTEARVLWDYLSVYLLPLPERLHVDYEVVVSRSLWAPPTTWVAILAILATLVGAWRLRSRLPMLAFALLFFFLASSLEASFINLELAFIHRLYLPSLFLFFGLISAVPQGILPKAALAFTVLLALFASGTVMRNAEWNTRAELWAADAARGASRERATLNRSVGLVELGRSAEAIPMLDSVLGDGVATESLPYRFNLATALYYKGDYDEALRAFSAILADHPRFTSARFYLGQIHLLQGALDAGLEAAEAILADSPNHPYGRILLAEHARATGDVDKAVSLLQAILDETPKLPADDKALVRMHLANALLAQGDHEHAYQVYLESVREAPENYYAWTQIYRMQLAAGDTANAERIRRFLESKQVLLPPAPGVAPAAHARGG
jgi:tetratricopeptide (TPR) repeat protein